MDDSDARPQRHFRRAVKSLNDPPNGQRHSVESLNVPQCIDRPVKSLNDPRRRSVALRRVAECPTQMRTAVESFNVPLSIVKSLKVPHSSVGRRGARSASLMNEYYVLHCWIRRCTKLDDIQ